MATIELTPVLIHYTVSPKQVHARVRLYAGDIAIREETIPIAFDRLQKLAESAGRKQWTHEEVCAAVGEQTGECLWGGDEKAAALIADVLEGL